MTDHNRADDNHACHHEREFGELSSAIIHIHAKLDLILAQAVKTNGRVGALEKWRTILMAVIGTAAVTNIDGLIGLVRAVVAGIAKVACL